MNSTIRYPSRHSGAEIQAELWRILKELGYDIRLEAKHVIFAKGYKYDEHCLCRFDAVVFDKQKQAKIIIEVKNFKDRNRDYKSSKQYQKYSQYGAKLIYCIGMEDIPKIVEFVKSEM